MKNLKGKEVKGSYCPSCNNYIRQGVSKIVTCGNCGAEIDRANTNPRACRKS
jgi:hypothetical protein